MELNRPKRHGRPESREGVLAGNKEMRSLESMRKSLVRPWRRTQIPWLIQTRPVTSKRIRLVKPTAKVSYERDCSQSARQMNKRVRWT